MEVELLLLLICGVSAGGGCGGRGRGGAVALCCSCCTTLDKFVAVLFFTQFRYYNCVICTNLELFRQEVNDWWTKWIHLMFIRMYSVLIFHFKQSDFTEKCQRGVSASTVWELDLTGYFTFLFYDKTKMNSMHILWIHKKLPWLSCDLAVFPRCLGYEKKNNYKKRSRHYEIFFHNLHNLAKNGTRRLHGCKGMQMHIIQLNSCEWWRRRLLCAFVCF